MTNLLGPDRLSLPRPLSDVAPVAVPVAANDNEAGTTQGCLLHAALRHFAEHGLGAAELAHQRAEQAFFSGDSKEYRYWLEICRALDRRMAERIASRR